MQPRWLTWAVLLTCKQQNHCTLRMSKANSYGQSILANSWILHGSQAWQGSMWGQIVKNGEKNEDLMFLFTLWKTRSHFQGGPMQNQSTLFILLPSLVGNVGEMSACVAMMQTLPAENQPISHVANTETRFMAGSHVSWRFATWLPSTIHDS